MARRLTLTGGTLYRSPFDPPVRDSVVILDGHEIAEAGPRGVVAVPEAARTIDCAGMTVLAGFWNSHVHFFQRKWADATALPASELALQLADFTRYGFTSVFDLSSDWTNTRALRDRIESGEVAGPRIRSTGQGLVPPGGMPPDAVLQLMGLSKTPLPEVETDAQATSAANKLLDEGVDAVKVFLSSQSGVALAQSTVQAAVAAAHARGKRVFAHPNNAADVLCAMHAGVDVIAHTTPQFVWDPALLALIAQRRPALTPTLGLWKFFMRHDRASLQDRIALAAAAQLQSWVDAGGTVLFGTDAGAVETDPTAEYEMMTGAGMSFRQILAALTTAPAEQFGQSLRLGRINAGYQADVVVVKGEPEGDIRALSDVQYTLRAGSIMYAKRGEV